MQYRPLLFTLAATLLLAIASGGHAQKPTKPLTETDLLNTIDKLGAGDPIRKSPADSTTPAATPLPKTGKEDKDKAAKPGRSKNGQTEITADEGSFDQHTHQAIFSKRVFVKNPDFSVKCDKLTAFMKHEEVKTGGSAAAATPKPPATPATPPPSAATPGVKPASKGGGNSGALERAIAEGNVEIIQDKIETDGSVTHNVGHAKRADYDAKTGDVILTVKPDVQTGINTCVALEEGTVMILNRAGQMSVKGPHQTVIRDGSSESNLNGR